MERGAETAQRHEMLLQQMREFDQQAQAMRQVQISQQAIAMQQTQRPQQVAAMQQTQRPQQAIAMQQTQRPQQVAAMQQTQRPQEILSLNENDYFNAFDSDIETPAKCEAGIYDIIYVDSQDTFSGNSDHEQKSVVATIKNSSRLASKIPYDPINYKFKYNLFNKLNKSRRIIVEFALSEITLALSFVKRSKYRSTSQRERDEFPSNSGANICTINMEIESSTSVNTNIGDQYASSSDVIIANERKIFFGLSNNHSNCHINVALQILTFSHCFIKRLNKFIDNLSDKEKKTAAFTILKELKNIMYRDMKAPYLVDEFLILINDNSEYNDPLNLFMKIDEMLDATIHRKLFEPFLAAKLESYSIQFFRGLHSIDRMPKLLFVNAEHQSLDIEKIKYLEGFPHEYYLNGIIIHTGYHFITLISLNPCEEYADWLYLNDQKQTLMKYTEMKKFVTTYKPHFHSSIYTSTLAYLVYRRIRVCFESISEERKSIIQSNLMKDVPVDQEIP
ncbi:hypothetical protein TVAG_151690 [Trichomonas vaginalis G3]|uniref:USP domain-containing protein n=1 Tax=Trichomonas vaginalis (strain ATCC PRA-98 / G3) TaxID=412133 RepID=A2ELT4_TRIV3|nr:nucleobindin family [Trichomonas vaginalis G3]EAY06362.1 hypothetical protein TVAG_151690 [Trichomonas vaginalis G3]KAI5534698.1 nucleobindin family [Trichomonas vaginalis G3]|eukprot:XP_001318585.1 hypothetical protein [Trichomonas vaginalis G3]